MKINYIAFHDHEPHSGVTKKILSQVKALRRLGIDTELFFLAKEDCNKSIEIPFVEYVPCPVPPHKGIIDKVIGNHGIKKVFQKLFSQFLDDEVVYIRNHIPTYWFYKLIKQSRNRVIIEIVSNKSQEALLRKGYLKYFSLKIFNNYIFNVVSGVVSITRELIDKSYSKRITTPFVVIGNGIDLEDIPVRQKLEKIGDTINLTCVANVCKWHGLDRVLRGISIYKLTEKNSMKRTYKFHLNIVGDGPEILYLRQLSNELNLNGNVSFHGFLKGEELNSIFEITDIGIANLATFRKNLEFTSPLKSREYCGRGVPFIYTKVDEDFPASFPYAKKVDSGERPLDLNQIIQFYTKLKLIKDVSVNMRKYAAENLTWDKKMPQIKSLLT